VKEKQIEISIDKRMGVSYPPRGEETLRKRREKVPIFWRTQVHVLFSDREEGTEKKDG